MAKKRVFVFIDGSNFYHLMNQNFGSQNIDFYKLCERLIIPEKEEISIIKYFNSPLSQNEDPVKYSQQQKFFEKIRGTEKTQLFLGRLAKRPINYVNITCSKCGPGVSTAIACPKCHKVIPMKYSHRVVEKGVDIKIATHLLIDAINDKYDVALLISSDADFCPAVEYLVKELKKTIVYCHFPKPITNELKIYCSTSRTITEQIIKAARVN